MTKSQNFSMIPALDELLRSCASLQEQFGRPLLQTELKNQLAQVRTQIKHGELQPHDRNSLAENIISHTETALTKRFEPSLQPVINLTGVILHTNLGRAPYPQVAIDAMVQVSRGACNLEYDIDNGKRGRRDDHIEQWVCALTGAEAATTVNNNAAAVLLTLNTLAVKKEVIVSRGELIEIGGSFRMPAIMEKAGCKLREVGTTNRTHLHDYQEAIGKRTGALMKVHTSNFEVTGFNQSVPATALTDIANEYKLPLIDDMGSGSLVDLEAFGLPAERTAQQAIDEGVDIITFSGDKLLGGPQCGIIAGRRDLIKRIDKNPIKRAMRLDKVTLAALEAILKLYATPQDLTKHIPTLSMLTRPLSQIEQTAHELKNFLSAQFSSQLDSRIEPCESQIGSGSLPTKTLTSRAVVLNAKSMSAQVLAGKLRSLQTPVIGRIHNDEVYLDVRAVDTVDELMAVLKTAAI